MISEIVTASLEATLRLAVQASGGPSHWIEAVIDPGFSGFLTLPPTSITLLGLPWLCRQQGLLADGSLHVFDVYAATVLWDGQSRAVEIDAVDAQPLLGMRLLHPSELRIEVVSGGRVSITVLP